MEDGIVFAGVMRDDRQVVRYGEGTGIYFDAEERVEVSVWPLRPVAGDGEEGGG